MERLYNENHNGFIEIYKKYESENYIAIAMELGEFNLKKYIDDIPETKAKASNIFYFLVELNKCLKFLVKKNKIIVYIVGSEISEPIFFLDKYSL